MKKICLFIGDITRSGGTERVAASVSGQLTLSGKYEVIFLSLVEQNPAAHFPLPPQIRRYVLDDGRRWLPPGPAYLPLLPRLRRFLKEQRPDIIIDIDIVLDSLSIPASIGLPVKVISWEHFHYYFEQESLYRRWIARFSARFSDYMVTLTPEDMENYRQKLHRKDRIRFIYNPMEEPEDAEGTPALPRERALVTVGRLEEVKGVDLLAQIAPRILNRHPDWKWYLLGDGSLRPLLEQVRTQHRLEEQLVLTGVVANVEEYLRRASIYVLASRTESFGMCILEAKCCGLPCVSFDVPYGPNLLIADGQNGFLVPPFDLDQMADKISRLITDDALRERFAQNAGHGLEAFRPEAIRRQWEELLDSL